ncbi:MAG: cation-translocating P-type ATPase [Bacteroidota bacterium]|nr:cation-translocating P-type ATPase [Bacteroidota bacterium]MDP4232467.1 cation-translocating P-type ATPase [Bacteroidota bacterium]MDP4241603.1 cation-translocating P-type ATPase [Bacteroidota bacterium]MDP4286347.1 cation-translocating P-type ATPase [Bacteroidota bacterium]
MPEVARQGLSNAEAAERLLRFGHNELPEGDGVRWLKPILKTLGEPMILLLLATAGIYMLLGDRVEAALLSASALFVVGISLTEEIRSDRALRALRDMASPRALVLRDGKAVRVAAREIVPDDLLILAEGDRIAADADLISASGFAVDESLLSGESVAAEKSLKSFAESKVFSGTLAVRGSALARVFATGARTEFGRIGSVLAEVVESRTPLQKETGRLVRLAAIVGVGVCLVVVVIGGLMRGNWIEATLAGLALAISLLPEEFPVILSVFLALGARRLAATGMLVHRMPAVEGLGTVTALCVDKTGTLTKNIMTLAAVQAGEHVSWLGKAPLSPEAKRVLWTAELATKVPAWDPMDRAVQEAADGQHGSGSRPVPALEVPITSELAIMFNGYSNLNGGFISAKGMPEAVASLCRMPERELEALHKAIRDFAVRGMRVLGVAESNTFVPSIPLAEHSFVFLGLVAFHDPLRDGVPDSVQQCYTAGIRVIMITGDYPATAAAIAREAGIQNADTVLTGTELSLFDAAEFRERLRSVNVFARIKPMQKLQIVQALRDAGEIVVMTGDGINDAPALKAAHIGVAMGARGTDVAREAAAMVLTQDDFSSLVGAVRLGRRTYDNIKKAMYYVIAMHIPIAGLSILPLVLGMPLILFPIHIVLLELIIDPMSSIVFESEGEEADIMRRPPRDPKSPMFRSSSIMIALLQGLSIFAVVSIIFLISYGRTHSEYESRTLAFATLILSNLILALVDRSWARTFIAMLVDPGTGTKNRALWWCVGGGLAMLFLITTVPSVSVLFHFGPFHFHDWILTAVAAGASLAWFEIFKLLRKRTVTS